MAESKWVSLGLFHTYKWSYNPGRGPLCRAAIACSEKLAYMSRILISLNDEQRVGKKVRVFLHPTRLL